MLKDSFTKRRPFAIDSSDMMYQLIVTIGVLVLINYCYNYRYAMSGTDDEGIYG
jgi:hypothetical protein